MQYGSLVRYMYRRAAAAGANITPPILQSTTPTSILERRAYPTSPTGFFFPHQRTTSFSTTATSQLQTESTTSIEFTELPTRHSRHLPPPVCNPDEVDKLTDELLSSEVGSWYSFNPDKTTEDDADAVSDDSTQWVEYVLRGHSALIPGSITNGVEGDDDTASSSGAKYRSAEERAELMEQLVDRIEQEGILYNKNKLEYLTAITTANQQQQLIPSNHQPPTQDEQTEDEEGDTEKKKTTPNTISLPAAPGPSISMYDLTLDAWALSTTSPHSIQKCEHLFQKALRRHKHDGGSTNTNPKTIPTVLTFNALIRAAANAPYDPNNPNTIRQRDEALNAAFLTYSRMMRFDAVQRNSNTYRHLLCVLRKYIPPSRSRGNMAHALFQKAKSEGLMDQPIVDELNDMEGSGKLYDEWLGELMGVEDMPKYWKRNVERFWYGDERCLY